MTNQQSLDQDALARNQIVSDMGSNFFVEAGAGSGKTTMLVNRMAAMVESDLDIDISKICAITFTKAAAGEFRKRFHQILSNRSNPDYKWEDKGDAGQLPMPTEVTRERCARALQNIDLCFMGTIDSFCSMVLSEHPYEAGIPSDSHIITDGEMEAFVKQMYVKICNGEYDDNSGNGETLSSLAKKFSMFHRNSEEVFVTGMTLFMNNRNVHFNFTPNVLSDNIDQDYARDKAVLLRTVAFLINHKELQYGEKSEKSSKAWEQITDIYNNIIRQWNHNLPNVLYSLKTLTGIRLVPEALDKYSTQLHDLFDAHRSRGKTDWLEITIGSPLGVYTRLEEHRYSATMTFLKACTPVIEKAMRDKGYLSFFDCLYYLRNMLRKDAEGNGRLIRHIYERHSYFLIDEFQDTNPLQAEIFFYLTAENPLKRWRDCVPRQGSLFIVGDPKQSIYRFRSADVTSFLNVKKLFKEKGGTVLKLTRNFRSTRVLCEFYNRVFTELLKKETDNQSKFEAIPLPDATVNEFQGIYTYKAYGGRAANTHQGETDPEQIERIIDTLAYHNEFQITVEKDEPPREIRYSDIMVITYGKKSLPSIMEHLANRGIPTKVEGKVPFGVNEALREVYKIYAAVAEPDNQAAFYGALTGSLFHFTWKDILVFKQNKGILSMTSPQNQENCNNSTASSVSKSIKKLHSFYKGAKRLSPAALFSKIIDAFKIYEAVEAEDLEVLYYTLELLRNAEKSGQIVSQKDGGLYIADLLNEDTDVERCLSLTDNKDCVRMANLHKVKGLEAPIIILAAASDKSYGPTNRVQHGEDSEGWIFALESERDAEGKAIQYCKTGLFSIDDKVNLVDSEETKEKNALKDEAKRLIYVAATRARNALIICNRYEQTKNGGEKLASKWKPISEPGLPDFFKNVVSTTNNNKPSGSDVNAEELYKDAKENCALNNRRMEAASYEVKRPSEQRVASKMDDEQDVVITTGTNETAKDAESSNEVDASTQIVSKHVFGTMVHKLMEMLVTAKNNIEPEELIKEIVSEYTNPSIEDSDKEKLASILMQIAATMRNGGYAQSNGLPQDLFSVLLNADEVYCEVPFCYKEKDADIIWNGTMDVVYCSGGKWHIVDYKTNADGNNLDEKYKNQLEAYRKAFQAVAVQAADVRTYHIAV